MAAKKKTRPLSFSKYIGFFLNFTTILALVLLYFIDILPLNFFLVSCLIMGLILLILNRLLKFPASFLNLTACLISLILSVGLTIGITYELNTLDFLSKLGFNAYKTENYALIVLKNSSYQTLETLNDKKIGHILFASREGIKKATEKISQIINISWQEKESITDLLTDLETKKLDAILLEETELQIISEEEMFDMDKLEIIHQIDVKFKTEKISKEVDITKEPFTIYLSGMDTYGKINSVSRSDVNMLITVNKSKHTILLTSIPRDYYVLLDGKNKYDKLTHAGMYGINTSVKTIENLLDIPINYYVIVNFTTLIDIVDALGGIEVDSKYNFTTIDNHTFQKGLNKLDGLLALSFSRERKAFKEGDRIRGENQQRVLTSIINKATSKTILIKYNDLLNAIKKDFLTNMDDKKIKEFIKEELESPTPWTISSQSLNGHDAYDYTYSLPKRKLYVMTPDEESKTSASTKIKENLKK